MITGFFFIENEIANSPPGAEDGQHRNLKIKMLLEFFRRKNQIFFQYISQTSITSLADFFIHVYITNPLLESAGFQFASTN